MSNKKVELRLDIFMLAPPIFEINFLITNAYGCNCMLLQKQLFFHELFCEGKGYVPFSY